MDIKNKEIKNTNFDFLLFYYYMDTKFWGPSAWNFLFCTAANYPLVINLKDPEHVAIQKRYKRFFYSLKDILCCKYCRQSWKIFIKELPIDSFLKDRQHVMYWLYLQKDKVNKKLIKQQKESLQKEMGKIKNPTKMQIQALKKKILYTKSSPPFESVCKKYEKHRASCSDKTKTCRKPSVKI